MMKKTYKSSLLALSVLASFTSCSESESLQQANLSKDKITFHATLDNSWKPMSPASSSRAAIAAATEKGPIVVPTPFGKPLYLHSVVQETADLQQAAATTRGAMQEGTTLGNTYYNNSFGVTAIYKDNGTNTALFTNQKASKNNEDIWEIEDKTNSRWPFDALVSFHAYAPFNNTTDGMWSVTTDAENVKTKIKYTAKSSENEIPSQPDIVVATNAESRSVSSDDKAVELKFSHALTAVNFAISKDLTEIFKTEATDGSKLKSITLSGIPNEGTCELTVKAGDPQTPSQNWIFEEEADGSKKTGSYTFNLENKNITIGESYALTSNEDKNILMMIPQNLQGTDAKLIFVLDIKGKGDQTFTFDLSNQTWLPGTSVTYKLSASAINHLENAEVVFPTNWNGFNYPKQAFENGESIGLYVVNSNNGIEEKNLKLTLTDGKWEIDKKETKILKLKGYKYFAYYPYNENASTNDITVNTAEEFFANMIPAGESAFVADQSEKATLLAQDFQVAKGEIDPAASSLIFNMKHQVGLVALNLQSANVAEIRRFESDKYKYYYDLSTQKPNANDYTDVNPKSVMASDEFATNKPCSVAANKYLQIIPFKVSVAYKANNKAGTKLTAWGLHKGKEYTLQTSYTGKPIASQDITVDAEFENLAHLFNHVASIQTFTAYGNDNMQYKLQCWGSRGDGRGQGIAGKGGYAAGTMKLNKKAKLYICVGNYSVYDYKSSYNNPFNNFYTIRGGGATSITIANRGELANFANFRGEVVLVAGAGGGCDWLGHAGDGGGSGGHYAYGDGNNGWGTPGTQSSGGYVGGTHQGLAWSQITSVNGGFGYGGAAYAVIQGTTDLGAQGGSGWYGGGGTANMGGGGGGSSYGNPTYLTNTYSTITGRDKMPAPKGGEEIGHADNGNCVISWKYDW